MKVTLLGMIVIVATVILVILAISNLAEGQQAANLDAEGDSEL